MLVFSTTMVTPKTQTSFSDVPWQPIRLTALFAMSTRASNSSGHANWRRSPLGPRSAAADLLPHDRSRMAHYLQLSECGCARHVFHAAVGRRDQPFGRDIFQPIADAAGDDIDAFNLGIAEIEHAEHDLFR